MSIAQTDAHSNVSGSNDSSGSKQSGDKFAVIVLAAGLGKRMKSNKAKVLHDICGRTLIGHVIHAVAPLKPARIVAVIGHDRDNVRAELDSISDQIGQPVESVIQTEQKGTGHAARVAQEYLDNSAQTDVTHNADFEHVLIVNGDFPLMTFESLQEIVNAHTYKNSDVTVMSAVVDNPYGMGRIVRDEAGNFVNIVEEADATETQKVIKEGNAGAYIVKREWLGQSLHKVAAHNAQGEEYLTDIAAFSVEQGKEVQAYPLKNAQDTVGCNDRAELTQSRATMRDRIVHSWLLNGVTVIDPASVWPDVTVKVEQDAVIEPNVQLKGNTSIASGSVIGPDTTLTDCRVEAGATVLRSHCVEAVIGADAKVGPYTYLRPGTELKDAAKAGAYVEIKASTIGEGSKVPHLSYIGDATVGHHTNLGAATITANYDGINKHHTVVGNHVRTGCDTVLVAPVELGDGAHTAAGSVVTKNIPEMAMAVARSAQRNIDGWVEKKRPSIAEKISEESS